MDYLEYADACEKLTEGTIQYENGTPLVSDTVYDELYKAVKAYELHNPGMVISDSPTQKIKSNVRSSTFQKVKHVIPMISIGNSNGYEELADNVKSRFTGKELVVEYKIDGMALDIKYDENGNLYQAVTRGDGEYGDDITKNAMVIKGIPHKVNHPNLNVRGEIVWKTIDFNSYNEYLVSICEEPLVNPRNGVAGAAQPPGAWLEPGLSSGQSPHPLPAMARSDQRGAGAKP
jgi:DNA ligase (NAD+)